MWLVDRGGRGHGRIPINPIVRDALVRWYTGDGNHHDEETGVVLVQQARLGERWIACDCLGPGAAPPLMTPAYLSEAETFYLRRLTGNGRPEHRLDCPFFHEQSAPDQITNRDPTSPVDRPDGYFSVLHSAPVRLSQQPEESGGGRERHAYVPRLARLLWRLLDLSGRNRAGLPDNCERGIANEFAAIQAIAERLEVAPGIELARTLWTHGSAFQRKRVYAGLRALATTWPSGHAPQAFLLLFAHEVQGHTVHAAGCDPIKVATRVQHPSVHGAAIAGPYLVLIVIGELPQAKGYAPLRAYAQPVYSGQRFIPVDSEFERSTLRDLLRIQHRLHERGHDSSILKPLFDIQTPAGNCRPDFIIETCSRATGESRAAVVESMGFDVESYHDAKAITHPRMAHIAPVVEITAQQLRDGHLQHRLLNLLVSG
ncbi:hypothetical protein DFR49_0943 [Hephaestia caeni]|uniref:DUF1173 family protein n=1 Tax=Hephaestia caeni TaxID=645617 RepID=A0A397PBD4_9SPHN|nr:hypothetical protein DFR49_0943 [Hephaestia caeni]